MKKTTQSQSPDVFVLGTVTRMQIRLRHDPSTIVAARQIRSSVTAFGFHNPAIPGRREAWKPDSVTGDTSLLPRIPFRAAMSIGYHANENNPNPSHLCVSIILLSPSRKQTQRQHQVFAVK